MDKRECIKVEGDIVAHLTTWAEDNGYQVSVKGAKYDPNAGFADITLTVIGKGGVNQEEAALKDHAECNWTDFKPEWIGATISLQNGRQAKIIGYKPRAHKYPFLVKCGNGDRYKVSERNVVHQLKDTVLVSDLSQEAV